MTHPSSDLDAVAAAVQEALPTLETYFHELAVDVRVLLAHLEEAKRIASVKHTGFAGHLIVAESCRFHLRSEVGDYLVSTVGAYEQPGKDGWQTVGAGRLFETFVFRLGGPCDCGNRCGERAVKEWSEIDSLPAQDPETATANHNAMIAKYLDAASLPSGAPEHG